MIDASTQDTGVVALSASQTAVSFSFPVYATSELVVRYYDAATGIWRTSALTLGVDYTATLTSPTDLPSAGGITLAVAAASGDKIRIIGRSSEAQGVQFVDGAPSPARTIEKSGFDRLITYIQRLRRDAGRALGLQETATVTLQVQEPTSGDDGKYPYLDWTNKLIKWASVVTTGAATVTAFGASLIAAADAAAARTLLSVADSTLFLLLDGTRAMTGALNMGSHKITNVTDPTDDQDAATKKYVTDNAASLTAYSRSATPVTVANTTTETTLFSFTVTGGDLGTLRNLLTKVFGNIGFHSSDTCTIRFKYGGTTFHSIALGGAAGYGSTQRGLVIDAILSAFGATDSQSGMASAGHYVQPAGSASLATLTKDSTADQTFLISAQWSAANASNSITAKGYTAFLIR